jgi:tRNA(adenine34) deaminase
MRILKYENYMDLALQQAKIAYELGEIPVGAVIVYEGEVIASAHNEIESQKKASAHAELLALDMASYRLNSRVIDKCTLFSTLEPCGMCAGAIANYRVKTLVFGAYDTRFGCCFSRMNLIKLMRANTWVIGGIREKECAELLNSFFSELRK